MKAKGATTQVEEEKAATHDATTNVVDFMALLKKSLEKKGEAAPAKSTARKAPAKKAAKKPATKTSTKSKKSA
jgi:DNA end-binding protein Ku